MREERESGGGISRRLVRLFYLAFSLCFAFVIWSVTALSGEALPLALGAAACFGLLCLLDRGLERLEGWLERRYGAILAVFCAVMFALELAIALELRHGTWFDVGAIHQGAVEWVETGTFAGFYEYYGYFPNNLGGMAFLYVFFKLAWLAGFTDYYAVAALVSSAMLTCTAALVSLICRRLAGARGGVLALAVFALSAQFYVMGGAVYTDTLSMLFPALVFWLYLLAMDRQGRGRIPLYLLMGLAAGLGGLIKITVLIMALAVVIDRFLRGGGRTGVRR